ncbi:MAG: winged helix-turn-helix domain-containing protein [Rhodothermales bacterium]|nr:winged helix-turn-helix domain-containing protein [Rhodothermales bacterium]MBO6780850.1 winged helix-turn-helix domain-containing protein [Rhodothermales bacterium]
MRTRPLEKRETEWRLGTWCVQPHNHRLVDRAGSVRIDPKLMDLLVCLADAPGETLQRAELLGRVWTGVVVSDDTLNQAISRLRRILGDDSRAPRYIETVPRVGYRLIAPVSRGPAKPRQWARRLPLSVRLLAAAAVLVPLLWMAGQTKELAQSALDPPIEILGDPFEDPPDVVFLDPDEAVRVIVMGVMSRVWSQP